jgi:hypothetical protein
VTVGGTLDHGIVGSAEEASPAGPAAGGPGDRRSSSSSTRIRFSQPVNAMIRLPQEAGELRPANSEVTEPVTAVLPAVDYNRMA